MKFLSLSLFWDGKEMNIRQRIIYPEANRNVRALITDVLERSSSET
jgi:hypothetical protein